MKKIYKIEVDCANCANLMEHSVGKIEGVVSANVNYITQKMSIEFADGRDINAVMRAAIKACKKIDSDFEIDL